MSRRRAASAMLGCACIALPVPAFADTLQEALAKAYADNPVLNGARATQRATDETVGIERSAGLPSLNATGTHIEAVKQNSTTFITPDRILTGELNLTVPLYEGGAVRNGIRAAKTRVAAGRADLRGTESAIFSQVVAAYLDVILNESLVRLSRSNVEGLSVNLEATRDRFAIGDLTRTDVAQSQSRLAIARSDLRAAEANLVAARENYIALIGTAPGDLQAPPPLPGLPDDAGEAVRAALEDNPDLLAAIERAEAAGFDVEVAGAGRLPTLSAFSSGSIQTFLGTLAPGADGQTSANVGLTLTIPLFQGGRPAAQRRQAQANEQAALENLVATERDLIAQVRSAFSSWRASEAIIESSEIAVEAAALSLEGVQAENTVGNRTVLDILDAQQELLATQVDLVTARRNAYVAGFSLLAAMGRAEARDLGLDEYGPLYDPVVNYERVRDIVWDWQTDDAPVTQSSRSVDIPAPSGDIRSQE